MVDRRQKFEKKDWIKRPIAVPKKRNLDQTFDQNLILEIIFWKILFRA